MCAFHRARPTGWGGSPHELASAHRANVDIVPPLPSPLAIGQEGSVKHWTASVLFAALSVPVAGQQPQVRVSLGDGTVDAARLKPYDNALVANQFTADGRKLVPGIWTDQLRLREIDGRKLWVRTQTLGYFDGRVMSSVNMFDPVTFAPVKNLLVNPDGSREVWTFGT